MADKTDKRAFIALMVLAVITGIVTFYAFGAVSPKSGVVDSIYRQELPPEATASEDTATGAAGAAVDESAYANKVEIKILKAFIASMAIYPIGSFVRLNTGEIAKVIGINHGAPFRPEIRIYFDSSEHKLDEPVRINLVEEEYTQTYIQETLESAEIDRIYQLMDE